MITIKFFGGLGNQLFGYALGRSLGQTEEVQFDPSGYAREGKRQYSLSEVGLNLPLGNGRGRAIHESSLKFDPAILNTTGDASLFGYWQSDMYFERVKDRIRNEVFAGMKTSQKATEIADTIGEGSAFIHVRRTDYMCEPHKSFHGNLSLDYYRDAVNLLLRKHPDLKFFVFSDDPEWCKQNFPGQGSVGENPYTVVEGTTEHEDLWLMSLCEHAIIANSSFSWWAAWLGADKRGGTVIVPEHWFRDPNADSSDIVPLRWVKLAN
jgi:hypothetical protein